MFAFFALLEKPKGMPLGIGDFSHFKPVNLLLHYSCPQWLIPDAFIDQL